MPVGIVASMLLVAAFIFLYPPAIGRHWVIALGVTTLVNMAACLAVGRRFRVLAVGMAVASLAAVAALLWYAVFEYYGTGFW